MYKTVTLTFAFFVAAVAGLPAAKRGLLDQYTHYQGDGSASAGWPSKDSWASWDDLWTANSELMKQSCSWNGWGINDSADEIDSIKSAIQQVSSETGIDNRFILAIMMQESKGCVRVPTTNNGVVNPGLMQSHNGAGTCANASPCASSDITRMISDGAAGTSSGDGLKQLLAKASGNTAGADDVRTFYAAARLYNSGSADYAQLGNGLGSTSCYASDIANRLTGWTLATTSCSI
ncbi:glycoside hydrolase [Pochonia chlamydosporia 170]|uniref:Glycoside hydrolase n=1 Tax=Pochonia chlamydosporia 170 TaxID=1380566 RepID=A0A179FVZ0_METCM|nr:glycoside hydrolase [Pochonia chlamydosporia 170]OAQ69243.1 glycoside hydrolase [Pochonia chlamydosporia 170]